MAVMFRPRKRRLILCFRLPLDLVANTFNNLMEYVINNLLHLIMYYHSCYLRALALSPSKRARVYPS